MLLRFEDATIRADPDQRDYEEFNDKHIYFTTAGIALTKILDPRSQTVAISAIPFGVVWAKVGSHDGAVGQSTGITVDWLFDGRTGMYLDMRYKQYQLERMDGSKMDSQTDGTRVAAPSVRRRYSLS